MSDIDEELLALAGDASSDEEEEDAPMNISRSASGSPADGSSANKGTARKAPAKKSRARGHTDSEEEGEA
jgi:RNA polymerase-associated protein RTF1